MSGKQEGEVVYLGTDKFGNKKFAKMVMVDGKLEPRRCDEDGNPASSPRSSKQIYKLSELIKTMRTKAKAKGKPKGWSPRKWPLDINNDDTICTHGSTTGPIDEEQIFYIQSRGLSYKDSVNMLIEAFYQDIKNQIDRHCL